MPSEESSEETQSLKEDKAFKAKLTFSNLGGSSTPDSKEGSKETSKEAAGESPMLLLVQPLREDQDGVRIFRTVLSSLSTSIFSEARSVSNLSLFLEFVVLTIRE